MAYDEALAARIRDHLQGTQALTEKKMFGGIGWMVQGNMAVGAGSQGVLIVRQVADFDALIEAPGARAMTRGDRVMRGWIEVDATEVATDAALHRWIDLGVAHALSLPPK